MPFNLLLFLLTFFFVTGAHAQQKIVPQVIVTGGDEEALRGKKKLIKSEYANDVELQRALHELMLNLQALGFIEASVDSQSQDSTERKIYIHIGPQYEWEQLREGNLEGGLESQVGFREKNFASRKMNYREVENVLNRIITYHENHGFPFATVKLDSVKIDSNKISASIYVEKNELIRYDTIAMHGDSRVSKKFIQGYLGVKPKGLYNESSIRKVNKRLREVSFLQIEKPMQIFFVRDQARLNFFLKDKKASRFDFLLGILPNNEVTGRVLITGEILMHLVSVFGRGEEFFINWKRLQARTQSLDVAFRYPYLGGSPIGADLNFALYKHDTLYLDIEYEIGFQYLYIGSNYIKTFVNNKRTNVLNVDTNQIIQTRRLPLINNVRNTSFGLEFFHEDLDYRFNPTDGFSVKLKAAAGTRRIQKLSEITSLNDPEIPDQTFESLYDSLNLNSVQYQFDYRLAKFWKIAKRSTVKTGITGGAIISKNIFLNEMYRIGGSRILRGFDEESIFASLFNVLTVEYRFLLSQNSNFHLFFDGAFVEDRSADYENDWPFGFGAGLTFETKAGVFGVSYALGRQQNNPVDFKSAKIHFGYINYF